MNNPEPTTVKAEDPQAHFFAAFLTTSQKLTARYFWGLGCVAALVAWWLLSPAWAVTRVDADSGNASRNSEHRLAVKVIPATKQASFQRPQRYTGSFVASREGDLAFERAGRVVRLLVDKGDSVLADQPLAELDRRHLNASRRQADARLAEAEAVLAELEAGPRSERIASARARLRSLEATRDSTARKLERGRKLVDSRSISREEFDDQLYNARAANAQVDQAQTELDELLAGTRREQIVAQKSRVEQLRAELGDIDHDLQDTTLRAPFAGVVSDRYHDEGAYVSPGDGVLKLVDTLAPELHVGLPVAIAAELTPGDELIGEVNGKSAPITVRSLLPELDNTTRTRTAVFKLGSSTLSALPGQIGRVTIAKTIDEAGFWAPTDSLTPRKRGLWAVYVAEGSGEVKTVTARDVEVLHTDGSRSYIRGALSEGEAMIAAGAHRVVEGQRVIVAANE